MKTRSSGRTNGRRGRANDPEGTRRDIVEVATGEFARKGYGGARVDAIATRTRTSKRMIYILYDREGDAEYFQVYTETVEERFFFEIVERRGYRGYGASNAAVRLAAQARRTSERGATLGGRLP